MTMANSVEWVGGPWDGSVFEVPDGLTEIEITLSTATLPNRMTEVADDEWDVQVPKSVPTRTLRLPVHRRMSDGAFIVRYSEITDDD